MTGDHGKCPSERWMMAETREIARWTKISSLGYILGIEPARICG